MLAAGKLIHTITVERQTETVAASGAVSKAWAPIVTTRAELVQMTADELLAGFGEAQGAALVFRLRWQPALADLTTADRLMFDGAAYDLDHVGEPERRRVLELRVVRRA